MTARKVVEVWQLFWQWAADTDEYGGQTPRPRTLEMRTPALDDPIAPTWEEWDQMMAAASETAAPWTARALILARFTGLRHQALVVLPWSAVRDDRLVVPGAVQKNQRGLLLPLHPQLAAELAAWPRTGPLVVGAPAAELDGRGHLDRNVRRAWRRAGVDKELWSGRPIHCIRSTIETHLGVAGVAQPVIDAILGHAARGVGPRHYRDRRRPMVWMGDALQAAIVLFPPLQDQSEINRLLEIARTPEEPGDRGKMAAGDGNSARLGRVLGRLKA